MFNGTKAETANILIYALAWTLSSSILLPLSSHYHGMLDRALQDKGRKTPRTLSPHPHPCMPSCMQRALLDESLKSRVRAIGVEAELKHKQRQAVVLDKRDMGREWCGW